MGQKQTDMYNYGLGRAFWGFIGYNSLEKKTLKRRNAVSQTNSV